MHYETDQEEFWAGDFGTQYVHRNNSDKLLHHKVAMWSRMLRCANNVSSVRELGCNVGLNLLALNRLRPDLELGGIEINKNAAKAAVDLGIATIYNDTILKEINQLKVDLTFTIGVLIHINPDYLDAVYKNLVAGSNRYVLIAEYYNPFPTESEYRGHSGRLFKRDFAGDLMDNYGLNLIDYGFVYRRDNFSPQDDITWFLLEK